jgi:predicted amidohydrolase
MEALTGERERNLECVERLVRSAADRQPHLIVLPEFFGTGYFPVRWDYSYMELAEPESGPTLEAVRGLAGDLGCYIAATFFEIDSPGLYFDTTVIVDPRGQTCAKYRKTHPPARVSVEKIYYRPGSHLPVFDLLGWKIGILICYDNYLTEPARVLSVRGVDLILAPFAEVTGFDMWTSILRTRAFENGVYVVACNLVGEETKGNGQLLSGESLVIDPEGRVLCRASGDSEAVLCESLNREVVVAVRAKRQFRRDRRPELYGILGAPQEDAVNDSGAVVRDWRHERGGVEPRVGASGAAED